MRHELVSQNNDPYTPEPHSRECKTETTSRTKQVAVGVEVVSYEERRPEGPRRAVVETKGVRGKRPCVSRCYKQRKNGEEAKWIENRANAKRRKSLSNVNTQPEDFLTPATKVPEAIFWRKFLIPLCDVPDLGFPRDFSYFTHPMCFLITNSS